MRFFRKLAIAVLSLLLFFAILEGGLRLAGFAPRGPITPMFSWVERGELYTMTPGRQWVMPLKLDLVRANSMGLRGPEILAKPPGWQRILVLGDSVAFGYEVPEKRSLPVMLARSLQGKSLPVETVSAAIPGWSARQQRLFLEKHGRELDPDLIVATVVLNDFEELQLGEAELEATLRSANTLTWLAEHSAVAAALRALVGRTADPFGSAPAGVQELAYRPNSAKAREAMALEREELVALAEAARAQGVPLVLVLLPYRFQMEDPSANAPQKELSAFAEENGILALDLLPRLGRYRSEEVFFDNMHLTETGNVIVAAEIAEWLGRRRLLGQRRPARPS